MSARFSSLLIIVSLFVGSAHAEPAAYSITWFEQDAHTGARLKALRLCRDDHKYYDDKETKWVCENAEAAENRLYYKRMKLGLNELNTLKWWMDNRDLRFSTLKACQRRAPYDRDMLQYCDLARDAEQQSAKRVRG